MTLNLLFQNIIILFIFLILYELLYRWSNRFLLNRLYLLSSIFLSISIPFLSFKVFPYTIGNIASNNTTSSPDTAIPIIPQTDWILYIYIIGSVLSFLLLFYKITKVIILIKNTQFDTFGKLKIANNYPTTYSFFQYIFLTKKDGVVLNHEVAHASKLHSIDILILEFTKSILWFNPLIYRFSHLVHENHEFEADFIAMNQSNIDKQKMAEYLLDYIKHKATNQLLITNNFFSLTKNRIKMLSKKATTKNFSYALIIPIFMVVFSAFTFKTYPVYENQDKVILQDTLIPGTFTSIDSIVVYDPDTYKESISIVKTKIPMDEYIKELNLSGKLYSSIDTVPTYDPDTKEEGFMIYHKKYPYELRFIFHTLSWKQQEAIIKEYGSMTKEVGK